MINVLYSFERGSELEYKISFKAIEKHRYGLRETVSRNLKNEEIIIPCGKSGGSCLRNKGRAKNNIK